MRRTAAAVLAIGLAIVGGPDANAMQGVDAERLAGPTRYDTAAAVARAYWEVIGSDRPTSAVLTRGDDFADSLAAANVPYGLPLLTTRDSLPPATRWMIKDLAVQSVVIVGGTAAVSGAVVQELRSLGVLQIDRVAGSDRYATATASYFRRYSVEGDFPIDVDGKTSVMLASGENYPDALAAGPLASRASLPLLLTARDHLPAATRDAFDRTPGCPNGICIEQALILGGTDAVSAAVESELVDMGVTVRRIAGPTRQATAIAIANFARDDIAVHWTFNHLHLARGDAFPDALVVARLGAADHALTLLTSSPMDLGDEVRQFLTSNRDSITSLHVIGDEGAVGDGVVREAIESATSGVAPDRITGIEGTTDGRSIAVTVRHADCDVPSRVDVAEWDDRIEIAAVQVGATCNDIPETSTINVTLGVPLGQRYIHVVRSIAPATCVIDGAASDWCLAVT